MGKQKLPTEKDVLKTLDNIDKFNIGSFGKEASIKNASAFKAANVKESTGKEFGKRLTKRLKVSKELDF